MSRWNLLKRYAAPAVGALLLLAPLLVAQEPKPDRAAPSARQTPDARPASPAVEPKPEAQEPAELTQIRAAARDYLKAIHDGDYAAASKFWNPEGDYVDSAGHTHKIRELFAKQAANAEPRGAARPGETGATPPSAAQKAGDSKPGDSKPGDRAAPAAATPLPTVGTLRLVTPDVAIEDGSWRPPAGAARRSAYSRFTAIWTRHDGRWQLDSLREAVMTNISPAARLHALEWLIGEWTATQGPVQLKMTCAWGPDRNFIVRELRGEPPPIERRSSPRNISAGTRSADGSRAGRSNPTEVGETRSGATRETPGPCGR